MEFVKDFLVSTGLTMLVGFLSSLAFTYIKNGQIEKIGYSVGKWLDKLGKARLGKETWEKLEDIFTTALFSFAKGLKEGADWDDAEVKNLLNTSNRNGAVK